jgi:hypothetical protein
LLRLRRRTSLVATASVFAALYAILGAVPVSKLVLGTGNFLTASNFVAPLGGMLFGPTVGGMATLVGDLIDANAGFLALGPTGFAVVAADLATVLTAAFAFSGRRAAALALPVAVIVLYWVDPISVLFVSGIPFTWLHMVSVVVLIPVLALQARAKISKVNPAFVVGVTFAALMCGQVTGTLVGQELSVRVYGTLSLAAWRGIVPIFFPLYPVERIFFTLVSSVISIPVLRALTRMRRDDLGPK